MLIPNIYVSKPSFLVRKHALIVPLLSQNTHKSSGFSLADVFSKETFSPSFINNDFIISLHCEFAEALKTFFASVSDCIFYSRYYRGFICFHSLCYARRGYPISHFVSVDFSSCITRKTCFTSILFFFLLHNRRYAFVKLYPCLAQSLLCTLRRPVTPFVKNAIDSHFKFFDEEVFLFKILPVSSIVKKVIKIPTLQTNICSFTSVDFEFEHD